MVIGYLLRFFLIMQTRYIVVHHSSYPLNLNSTVYEFASLRFRYRVVLQVFGVSLPYIPAPLASCKMYYITYFLICKQIIKIFRPIYSVFYVKRKAPVLSGALMSLDSSMSVVKDENTICKLVDNRFRSVLLLAHNLLHKQ